MLMPQQNRPVARSASRAALRSAIGPSDSVGCSICKIGCQLLPSPAKEICLVGCEKVAC